METNNITTNKNVGLYVHIPFCKSKCPYCDFYSFTPGEPAVDRYTEAAAASIGVWQSLMGLTFDTVYFGGGTPSFIGAERLAKLAGAALAGQPKGILREFTVECNPGAVHGGFFDMMARCGVNRISLGLQSAADGERKALGRLSDAETALEKIREAQCAGISNISFDLMLGVPGQTADSLKRSIDFCAESGATHVSAYILKLEERTPFYKNQRELNLPDEGEVCGLYTLACEALEQAGFAQYEVSNFARPGYESLHNLKYWNAEEYLGIGPSAHSFLGGRRFCCPRDIEYFLAAKPIIDDGAGGGFEEYAMLRLRLTDGLTERGVRERFGHRIPGSMRKSAERFQESGHLVSDRGGIRLTRAGFLLSNYVIGELLGT